VSSESGNSNNTLEGGGEITVPYGGVSADVNELAILSLGVLDPPNDLTVTPPVSTNPWNLLASHSAGTDYAQYIYWHAISSAEALETPTFTFTFSTSVRATGVAIVYENTCTQTSSPSPCFSNGGSPILDLTTGTATESSSVTETSALSVQALGVATCVFGTSNSVGFTDAPTSPTTLTLDTGNEGTNASLDLYDRRQPTTTTDGPWQATIPGGVTGDNVAQCVGIIPIGF